MCCRIAIAASFLFAGLAAGADAGWVASWTAAVHGPYPSGNAVGQPDLHFAFPEPSANDQTFRLIIHPDLWGTPRPLTLLERVGGARGELR